MTSHSNTASPGATARSFPALRMASLALVLVTISALAAVTYFTERGILVKRDWVIHTYQVRSELDNLQLEIMRAQAHETNYLLMGEKNELPQAKAQSYLASQTVNQLSRLTRDNLSQQQRLVQLAQTLKENSALIEGRGPNGSIVELPPKGRTVEEEIGTHDQQIDSILKSMQDEEETLLQQRLKDWGYLFKRNLLMLALAFSVVGLMLAYNFRALISEVAETKNSEKRVRGNAESYRLMSARILELQDLERRRVARELHDSVGQSLAGLKINLSQMDAGANGNSQLIRETIALTDSAIQEVRTISHLLHPPLLEELGFLTAARWYVDEYGKRGQVKVSLLVDEPFRRLPRDVEIALFRVLQEALTNVYRHADAQSIEVRIWRNDRHVRLTVADDGIGIPEQVLAKFRGGAAPGIGLAGMRERLAEFGGTLNVESSGGGAVVEAVIPTTSSSSVDTIGA